MPQQITFPITNMKHKKSIEIRLIVYFRLIRNCINKIVMLWKIVQFGIRINARSAEKYFLFSLFYLNNLFRLLICEAN